MVMLVVYTRNIKKILLVRQHEALIMASGQIDFPDLPCQQFYKTYTDRPMNYSGVSVIRKRWCDQGLHHLPFSQQFQIRIPLVQG